MKIRLPSQCRVLNSKANFATAQLCNLVKLITTLATIFYLDNEKFWLAFRPKTFTDIKKKKKLAVSEFALMGFGVYIVQGNKQNGYAF